MVFVSAAYGEAIRPTLENLSDLIDADCLIGATAEGVLANNKEYESDPAVTVWMASLPGAEITPLALEHVQTPDGGTFLGWPDELDWPTNASLLLVADPFSFPVDDLISRLAEDRPDLPIIGGMASGGSRPGSNTLVINQQTYDAGAVGDAGLSSGVVVPDVPARLTLACSDHVLHRCCWVARVYICVWCGQDCA
ncbi:MAG: hypothetical protein EBY61_10370, partial [Actinobacteria bacterium]|nr:hypothetical protein [Actinomycetota bacterium]